MRGLNAALCVEVYDSKNFSGAQLPPPQCGKVVVGRLGFDPCPVRNPLSDRHLSRDLSTPTGPAPRALHRLSTGRPQLPSTTKPVRALGRSQLYPARGPG